MLSRFERVLVEDVVGGSLVVHLRSSAESVLVTQLLKGIRDVKADIDLVALECLKEQSLPVPDTHTQASAFMQLFWR